MFMTILLEAISGASLANLGAAFAAAAAVFAAAMGIAASVAQPWSLSHASPRLPVTSDLV